MSFFLGQHQHYYYKVIAQEYPPKIEQITATETDLCCHYRSFAFHHCLTALGLLPGAN